MFFKDFVSDEFGNFNNFVERKYVLCETAFTRKGKLSLEAMIKYPLCNHKKTTSIEVKQQITRKPKETTKYKYKYKTNINTLIGNIKEEMFRLLTDDKEEINIAIQDILDIASKDLVYTKINPPTNEEREKDKYYHKKCKSNIQDSF